MELSKNFEPKAIENKWYKHWLDKKYFHSQPDDRPPFTVVIPPPNVTGVLHMGHTLNETVQDILVRKARMSGFNACWVPGSDHASIATEAKVVGMLKEKGIDKNELSREQFLEYAFEWKEKYGNIIYNQIERLGCSVDWNRTTFTMDKHYYNAVIKTFVDLYNKGMIYRGARMINWDVAAKTALSDEEVEHKDIEGKLYHIKYFIEEYGDDQKQVVNKDGGKHGNEAIIIATQRPETIMGDTAIAVNPNDERYAHLKGAYATVPLINRRIPIIFDDYVDPAFGSGALKVTPAHDINDYNLGLKHNLEIIDTLNPDGTLSAAAQLYIGADRFAARKMIIKELEENGNILKEEKYNTRLGYSQRTGVVVEPRISTQWFVKMSGLTSPALDAVVNGEIKIHPGDKFLATYKYWLENVRDWCISRQLWWGQQIPAWYAPDGTMVVAETKELAIEKLKLLPDEYNISDLKQDEDVLDTWFSSWLWPMEVFKGISDPGNADINYYYPGSVLVTGQDIIFFWVARMVMAGMEYEKQKPFSDVYFTGMVRDKEGRKMSKSLGNSPDLLDLIDKYGADAVRFGIMISSPAGNDLLFDEGSLEQGRNFNNKMWNALKLVKMWEARRKDNNESNDNGETNIANNEENSAMSFLAPIITHASAYKPQQEVSFAVTWFENRLKEVRSETDTMISQFRLSEALKTIYSLIWDDFCSWYLEWIKPGFEQPIEKETYKKTVQFFTELLQLLHPFMPFVTEEIYHLLQQRTDDLCVKQFKNSEKADHFISAQGQLLKDVITGIRDVRNKQQVKPKETIILHIDTKEKVLFQKLEKILLRQVNAVSAHYVSEPVANSVTTVIGKNTFYIETGKMLDTGSQKEYLLKELNHLQGFLVTVEKKLGNAKFMQNAKPEVLELEKKKKADAEAKIIIIEEILFNRGDAESQRI
ncbi:MAG: valine--tRNA ligase [Ferruginibacter sp.]